MYCCKSRSTLYNILTLQGMTVYVLHPQSHKWMRGQVVDQENSNVTAQTEEGVCKTLF